jgi:formylglycine-generating enzyme required for sulfatase activity
MGSDHHYPDEAPAHRVSVGGFWIDRHTVIPVVHVAWQGEFPVENLKEDGYVGTAPVGRYPANGYGLLDMIGNVWEWTSDWYQAHGELAHACCTVDNPRGGDRDHSRDPNDPAAIPRRVMKGGSHLCAPNYCRRYRPAARMPQSVDTATSHLGFRCIIRGNDQR